MTNTLASVILFSFQCIDQRVSVLGLAHGDAEAILKVGWFVVVANHNAVLPCEAVFNFFGIATTHFTQHKVGVAWQRVHILNFVP